MHSDAMMEYINEKSVFKESEHPQMLAKELDILRRTGEFCDITICVDSRLFPAHRCVLSSACLYFRVMFSSGLIESKKDEIEIFGIDGDIFEMILTYIYTGSVAVIDLEDIQNLLVAANMLQVSSLKNFCSNYLQNRLDVSNCIGIYKLADMYNCMELEKHSKIYLLENFCEIFQSKNDEFVNLECEDLCQFLANEDLKIESEMQILAVALQWLTYKFPWRLEKASIVLSKVHFPLLLDVDISKCMEEIKLELVHNNHCSTDLEKVEKICRNLKKLQISVKYNTSVRRGAMKFLYIIGGYRSPNGYSWLSGDCLSGTEKFNFNSGKSTCTMPLMQAAKRSHAAAVVGGNIYVFGGECESLISNAVDKYNSNSNTWTQVGNMNVPRCGFGIAVVEEQVFLIGGCIGCQLTSSIDKYDIKTNEMQKVGQLLSDKAYFGCAVCEGNVYISGVFSPK